MKKLIISGSSKLYERALYWRGFLDGRGYDVIDWPTLVTDDPEGEETPPVPGFLVGKILTSSDNRFADMMVKAYQRYWRNLDLADVFFLMNEDRGGVEGYIGPSSIAELTYAITGNLCRGKKVEIFILKMPAKSERCYEEVKFWLDQGWLSIFDRKSDSLMQPETPPETTTPAQPTEAPAPQSLPQKLITPAILKPSDDKTIDLMTYKKKVLRPLTLLQREYLNILNPDFPAWLLDYIAAPEFQRLAGVSMACGMDFTRIYNFAHYNSIFCHSIAVALILWKFTHDKKQTLAGLFHDIASPSFKHVIDVMNGDAEHEESIEARTGEIIRSSKVICRQLKRDGILVSEVEDYKLYSLADNDLPRLAADRLEYTLSNGFFLYDVLTLSDVKTFYNDLCILENEDGLPEFGFRTPDIALQFTRKALELGRLYRGSEVRASHQFLADFIATMISEDLLHLDDLYTMSERELVDWFLSCGNHGLIETFRNFQRSTAVCTGSALKKNMYSTDTKLKTRYIVPLIASNNTEGDRDVRITELDPKLHKSVDSYLAEKLPKNVGFDFEFKPVRRETSES